MISLTTVIALLCVVGIAAGQVLFKFCARAYHAQGPWAVETLTLFFAAIVLYGGTTLAWIWVLSRADLGRVYPLMALAFVLVPLAGFLMLNERYSLPYVLGLVLIVAGIALTAKG